jgi:AraC family transcriptional regulator
MTFIAGNVSAIQKNGDPPLILASGSAPGQSGVSVVQLRFLGGGHFKGTLGHHVISFGWSGRMHCALADRAISHDASDGFLSVCPAGIDAASDTEQDLEAICVMVEPSKLSLAAAEYGTLEARLTERLSIHDQALLDLAWRLVKESRAGFPLGTVVWNETASRFIEVLAAHHMSVGKTQTGGMLDKALLMQMRDFIMANLDQPIDVATLARMARRSQFHFSRAFAQSVGISPYQYVIHLRLRHAVELVRQGRQGLAEIASSTGFADQSHLSRWIKRAHGVSITQLFQRPGAKAQESSIPRSGRSHIFGDGLGER